MAKMTTSASTKAERTQQQNEPDDSPTQDETKKDLEEEKLIEETSLSLINDSIDW